ncbi:NAD-dependent succinate-semialdehyde dehydrogenase [Sphingobacterium oryzagri]|uniref:NAD-dependent succinate-semialdehyde dehydrogenase n=1 Tax=Sphingobacterium oryzagri TaxID=3025669 RepID=A0ABY7WC69_9SPHI|nr:NAD-dependent succinate-semialdehyde dehydrogenase [Sphingobacterium sp. KACC 22765]WDF66788.1 NAD-dependent succinate-semialdehyde dehydrogenase [Sphingobacterium sp. KACC 22765]
MANSSFKTINPSNEETVEHYEVHNTADVIGRIEAADNAFHRHWKNLTVTERVPYLSRAAELMEERKHDLAKLAAKEMGKPVKQGESEVDYCIAILRYYAKYAEKYLADRPIDEVEHGKAWVSYEPTGVILSIQPWNFPFSQLVRLAAPNLVAGNALLVKPAKSTYGCGLAIQQIFDDAGLPEHLYSTFAFDNKNIEELIADKRIKGVALTGSDGAGAQVAAIAGKYVKKTVMELGGSDPFLVLENADINKAVKGAVLGRFANSGQVCTSSKRLIVVDAIHDEFVSKLKAAMADINVGDPLDADVDMGPMSSETQMDKVLEQIKRSTARGATLEIGGKRIDRKGFFIEPTLLTEVRKGQPAYDDEIFGPVAAVIRVKDTEEAIAVANDSPYGLGGTIFSEDMEEAKKVARSIETGMVFINRPTTSSPALPFGGVKQSGYGKELSWIALTEFVNEKLIRVTDVDAAY